MKSSPRAGFSRHWKLPPGPSELNCTRAARSARHKGRTWDRCPRPLSGAPCSALRDAAAAAAIDALGARRRAPRKRRRAATMAAMAGEQRYPRSSIEDDFNYGSNVASASVHIRMGKDCGWVGEPHGSAAVPQHLRRGPVARTGGVVRGCPALPAGASVTPGSPPALSCTRAPRSFLPWPKVVSAEPGRCLVQVRHRR